MLAHIVFKNVKITKFMQGVDVFEKFKFAGRIDKFNVEGLTPRELLAEGLKANSDSFETVAVIMPGHGAIVRANHKIFSKEDGSGWIPMDVLVKELGCDTYEEA